MKNKQKKCRVCKKEFTPRSTTQIVCGWECAIEHNRLQEIKERAQADKDFRRETKVMKEGIKTKPELTKEAQEAFNDFIRERDRDLPCIDCGHFSDGQNKTGGKWDAGHFLTIGGYPELRFNEDNCHKQLKSCNAGSGKYRKKDRTVSDGYRINLISKIGLEAVERLEGPHEMPHWTHDELRSIRDGYRQKLKELKKFNQQELLSLPG